jgi:filamentous hemagglutinin family protein
MRRLAAGSCHLGLLVWTLHCSGAGFKGSPATYGKTGYALAGASSLLNPRSGGRPQRLLTHGRGANGGLPAASKGTTRVAADINAFLSPAAATPGAGIVSDGSLGSGVVSYGNGTYTIPPTVGVQSGGNLFESFSRFNLLQGELADFQTSAGVQNILARIAGGNAASIDGTIQCGGARVNLFLIDPSGVVFGSHAKLNVSGAFTVSTADYVSLADGGKFNASLGADNLLTPAPASAFGFVGSAPAPVSFAGSQLIVPAGPGLNVIGGDVTLGSSTGDATSSGATLSAPGGVLSVFSAASAGKVPFSLATAEAPSGAAGFAALGTVRLDDGSAIAIDGSGGGRLAIRAGTITVDNSTISSVNSGSSAGGNITLQSTGSLSVLNGALIQSTTRATGSGGNLSIQAAALTVSGVNGPAGSEIRVRADAGSGDAGLLSVTAAKITLSGGGFLSGSSASAGNGGDVALETDTLIITGQTSEFSSGIFDSAYASGDAGKITINVRKRISITAGGGIFANADAAGKGGDLAIHAGSLDIDGAATPTAYTGISDQSSGGATGAAGDVRIDVIRALNIRDSGEVSASTFSSGKAGDLTIHAGSLIVSGATTPDAEPTGVFDQSEPGEANDAGGAGGDLRILAKNSLILERGGVITSDTFTAGTAGDVFVSAPNVLLAGKDPKIFTGISAETRAGATGAGGNITVDAGNLSIRGGAEIAASTFSSAKAGNLTVQAQSLTLQSAGLPYTGIYDSSAVGNAGDTGGTAGNLEVRVADALTLLDGGVISTVTTTSGNAGALTIQAGSLTIDGAADSGNFTGIVAGSDAGGGAAGDLTVVVPGAINITAAGAIEASTFSSGSAGKLTVEAGSMTIDGSRAPNALTGISDESDRGGGTAHSGGKGGSLNVVVNGSLVIEGGASIDTDTSTSANAGDVTVSAQSILIDGKGYNRGTYISAEAEPTSTGAGGNVTISAGSLVITHGGDIDTDTYDSHNAGDIEVHAGSFSILADPHQDTYLSSDTEGGGDAGNVFVQANHLLIDGKGYDSSTSISAEVEPGGMGAGGDLRIDAGTLVIRRGGEIDTDTNGNKDAGDLTINAGALSIIGEPDSGTYISSDTEAGGNAGNVSVTANSILLDGNGYVGAASISAAADQGATGAGGDVTVDTGALVLAGGGMVAASTSSPRSGGDITVIATTASISGFYSGIFATSDLTASGGAAGAITLQCDHLTLAEEAGISTNALSASAGDITVEVGQNATLKAGGFITSSAGVSGGNITLQTGGTLYLLHSGIAATAGTDRSANGSGATSAAGNGGNIRIDPDIIVLDDSLVSANAAIGQGGNILLKSADYLNSGSTVSATGATSGTVTITSPQLDLSGALIGLPSSPVSSETQLQETCAMALKGNFSSFLAVGQGDIEAGPDEVLAGFENAMPPVVDGTDTAKVTGASERRRRRNTAVDNTPGARDQ